MEYTKQKSRTRRLIMFFMSLHRRYVTVDNYSVFGNGHLVILFQCVFVIWGVQSTLNINMTEPKPHQCVYTYVMCRLFMRLHHISNYSAGIHFYL